MVRDDGTDGAADEQSSRQNKRQATWKKKEKSGSEVLLLWPESRQINYTASIRRGILGLVEVKPPPATRSACVRAKATNGGRRRTCLG